MTPPRITDHAVLRFLERVKGVDLAAVRAEMATPEVCAAVKAGARSVITQGHALVIENGTIITVLGPGMRPNRRKRRNAPPQQQAVAG